MERLAARGTTGLLVLKDGRVLYEWYAPGASAAKPHYTASLAKALVGGMSMVSAPATRRRTRSWPWPTT